MRSAQSERAAGRESAPDGGGAVTDAVLLIGHGSRDERGMRECETLVLAVERTLTGWRAPVIRCFLELRTPGVTDGLAECHRLGARRVAGVPLFLLAGGHVKCDLPRLVAAAQRQYPTMRVTLGDELAARPVLCEIMHRRLRQAGWRDEEREETGIVLAARGNRESEAQMVFAAVAADLQRLTRAKRVWTASLIGAGARLETVLAACRADRRLARVYIVPYVLFDGLILRDLHERVAHVVGAHTGAAPVVTISGHIGPDERLSRDIAAQIAEWLTTYARERDKIWENRLCWT